MYLFYTLFIEAKRKCRANIKYKVQLYIYRVNVQVCDAAPLYKHNQTFVKLLLYNNDQYGRRCHMMVLGCAGALALGWGALAWMAVASSAGGWRGLV